MVYTTPWAATSASRAFKGRVAFKSPPPQRKREVIPQRKNEAVLICFNCFVDWPSGKKSLYLKEVLL